MVKIRETVGVVLHILPWQLSKSPVLYMSNGARSYGVIGTLGAPLQFRFPRIIFGKVEQRRRLWRRSLSKAYEMVLSDYQRRGCLYKNASPTIKLVLFQSWTIISSTNRSQSLLPRLTSEGGMFAITYCILYPIEEMNSTLSQWEWK